MGMNVLWFIQSARNFELVWNYINRVDFVDKIIVKHHLSQNAYKIGMQRFFSGKYTHLLISHDDYLGSPNHIKQLIKDVEEHDFPVVSGWSNVSFSSDLASVSVRLPKVDGKRVLSYEMISMDDVLLSKYGFPFFKARFVGFPLTLIRRNVLGKVPFRPFISVTDRLTRDLRGIMFDLAFALDCNKQGVPITVDSRVFMLHYGKSAEMYKHIQIGKNRKVEFVERKK